MSITSEEFRSPRQVEKARPQLDTSCRITREQFAGLVGKYVFRFSEWQFCQMHERGSACRRLHGSGWVVQRKDGREGYIARGCAHFADETSFRSEVSRIDRDLRIAALLSRLSVVLSDPSLGSRLKKALQRQDEVFKSVLESRQRWPGRLMSQLEAMAKAGKRQVVIDVHSLEYDEYQRRSVYHWQPVTVGSVTGLESFDSFRVRQIGCRLNEASMALGSAAALQEVPELTLQAWAEALEDLPNCEAELDAIATASKAFVRPENLKLLWLLVRRYADQVEVIRTALECANGHVVSDLLVEQTRVAWDQEIRKAYGGRDFRRLGSARGDLHPRSVSASRQDKMEKTDFAGHGRAPVGHYETRRPIRPHSDGRH